MVPDFHPLIGDGRTAVGTWLTLPDPSIGEALADAGFDFLVADGEHGPIDTSELYALLPATRAASIPLLYRVGANEPVRIMHALDAGASGVIIPQVRTVADAERAIAWCRYPPIGLRGIAPRRASGYGRRTAAYLEAANGLVTCAVQIETREALDVLDQILAVQGLDTILVGPNDLASSLGHTGDINHAEVEAAINHIGERAQAAGVPAGVWTGSPTQARLRLSQGWSWVTVGSDYGFLVAAADSTVRDIRG